MPDELRRRYDVFTGEPGFHIERDPDTVRAPDVAFVAAERAAAIAPGKGFWPAAPGLAVEVRSGDTERGVRDTIEDWLGGGTREVWLAGRSRFTGPVSR